MSLNRASHLTLLPANMDIAGQRAILDDLIFLTNNQKHSLAVLFGKCEAFQQMNRCQRYFDFVENHKAAFEPYFRAAEADRNTTRLREAVNYLQMITYLAVMTRNMDSIKRRNYGYIFSGFEGVIEVVIDKIHALKQRRTDDLPLELIEMTRNSALAAGTK